MNDVGPHTLRVLQVRLLRADERNFHGWGHWQWVVAAARVPPEEALDFTTDKIGDNFSNYSAWHARTKLLAAAHLTSRSLTLEQLLAEDQEALAVAGGKRAVSAGELWRGV
jgi:Protein prenyltransferase alpha subunit repeat